MKSRKKNMKLKMNSMCPPIAVFLLIVWAEGENSQGVIVKI
jgi:hypothetical protein